jgi:endonuclease-3
MNRNQCLEIFQRFEKANPKPLTELVYTTDFELLVAVILSAQSTDARVNLITRNLFTIANTPEKILSLGEESLSSYIKSINYFKTKAKHIYKTSQILVDKYESNIPKEREALESLPGVGRKTANVILNVLFDQSVIAVDTHIFRVSNRIGLANGDTPLAVEKQLELIIPKEYMHRAHHWLVLHGRYTCIARKPLCHQCMIVDLCEYPNKLII